MSANGNISAKAGIHTAEHECTEGRDIHSGDVPGSIRSQEP